MASLDIVELNEKNTWNNIPGQKTTQGGEIFNNLTSNKAVANYSHAEGSGTIAYAIASHAEGEGKKLCNITLTGNANSTAYKGTISNSQTNLKYIHIGNLVRYNNIYAKIIGVNDPEGIITVDKTLSTTAISNVTAQLYSGATGYASHVEGYISAAGGDYSHAEGYDTLASGNNSHAEGQQTTASGENSHAEGYSAIAEGNYSHAEGQKTEAIGNNSHAEGYQAIAEGNYSHAEGYKTKAIGENSHTEGYETLTSGDYSHAEGYYTKAIGNYSHAEGYVRDTSSPDNLEEITLTGAKNATTYTYNSIPAWATIGDIIENNDTYAKITAINWANSTITLDKTLSSLEALDNTKVFKIENGVIAYGEASHAEGLFSQAIENYSHAEGSTTIAKGSSSHAEGNQTLANGNYSHAEGGYTLALGRGSHAEGDNLNYPHSKIKITGNASATTYTLISNSIIEEGETIVYYNSESSFATAKVISVNSTNKTFTVDKTLSSKAITQEIAFSLTSGALGIGSHIEGEGALASGSFSHAEGQKTIASGSRSHAEGAETIASGSVSHAEGNQTTASGNYSHAEGRGSIASSYQSHAEGYYTVAAGASSHAEGYYTIAAGEHQHVQGKYNIEDTEKIYSHIVGNGTSTTRSNAHTLDWSGNAWYAGNISAQGLTGSTTSTNYTHSVVVNSTTGQLEKVRPIDLNRKMASEAVGTDYSNLKLRGIKAGTSDLTAGVSELASGTLYIVYE